MKEDRQQLQWVTREASRCLFCYEAPCKEACPSRVDVPQFIRMLRWGDIKGAKRVIKRDNCLGGICAYVCPSEELCEKHCTFRKLGDPIPIARLQKFACDNAEYSGYEVLTDKVNKKIAIVGAGPAGLSCAHELRLLGYQLEMFEQEKFLGGTVTREIPNFKVPNEVIDRDFRELCTEEIMIHHGVSVSREFIENVLSAQFDAVFLGMGLAQARRAQVAGENLRGQYDAETFLKMVKEGQIGKLLGVCVTVGGGNTAMDCARTALRLGAIRSIVSYRRSRREMPADEAEFIKAMKEGVEFLWQTEPSTLNGSGELQAITLARTEPSGECGQDRRSFSAVSGTDFIYPANAVIWSLGKDRNSMLNDVAVACQGTVDKETLRIGSSKFFAGGDCISSRQTVVEAVAQGKRAARSMHAYLSAR
ncbi:MAG: FAD-dependent oxidoreductase [Deltaproteobacteria bacterium]|nr:FAD-dependent oxidoreductase [Deltaproteobacteria bacterium]